MIFDSNIIPRSRETVTILYTENMLLIQVTSHQVYAVLFHMDETKTYNI